MKFLVLFLFVSSISYAQTYSISGTVNNSATNEILAEANIFISELQIGTTSNDLGQFNFADIKKGDYTLKVSYVGFQSEMIKIKLNEDQKLTVNLLEVPILLSKTIIEGTYPRFRETSVAFSELTSRDIENRLGTREAVSILSGTPSAYVSEQGGGIGEQRLSLRGFDQTNIAVMINGIPINNPENGEIYWSNWVGISDLIEYVHVQRGLGAIPYSTSSIGGSVNFVTVGSGVNKPSFKFNEQFGAYNLVKSSLSFSTSLSENISLIGLLSRRTSDGYADQVYSDEYNYYLALGVHLEKHVLQIQVFGSPQKHGQRLTPLTISDWTKYGKKFNADWGYLNGKPLNLRDNEFHNPTLNIQYNWQVQNNLIWNNIISLSHGTGGGTVPPWYPFLSRTSDGLVDFNKEYQINSNNIDQDYDSQKNKSVIALRKGIHKNYWGTLISAIKYNLDDFILSLGIDGKIYEAQNYNEISNLLGGDYTIGSSNLNDDPNRLLTIGDKVDFNADSFTRSYGAFSQIEYKDNNLSAYLNLGLTNTEYNRIDYFYFLNSDPNRETGWKSFTGSTVKAGMNYNIDSYNNVYINLGHFSRAPLSMNVYDYGNNLYENVRNEKILSFEAGYGLKNFFAKLNFNYFNTNWDDKAFSQSYLSSDATELYYYNIFGASATHSGIEFDGELYLTSNLSLNSMFSYAVNKWNSDVDAYVRPESNPNEEINYHSFTKGLFVGNYPMTTASLGILFQEQFSERFSFYVNPIYNFFGRYYSKYLPELRTDEQSKGVQPWRIPDFYNIDIHTGFEYQFENIFIKSIKISFDIFNLFDKESIIDATDGQFHNASSALVWYGKERWWSTTFSVTL